MAGRKQKEAGRAAKMGQADGNVEALQLKDFGEYAVVLECTKEVLSDLEMRLSPEDAQMIYVLSVICFVQEYLPTGDLQEAYDASLLSDCFPGLDLCAKEVRAFLELVGQHPATCDTYVQDRIDASSGVIAIDGQVKLKSVKPNDLRDYGTPYHVLGGSEINALQAYDAIQEVPLTCTASYGEIDSVGVQGLMERFSFPGYTVFLIDQHFYDEENMGLFREGGRHFVIPVPESEGICQAMRHKIAFTDGFLYTRVDGNETEMQTTILYRESTVREVEELFKCTRSAYGDDRIVMFRDGALHDRMLSAYSEILGTEEGYTEAQLAALEPTFGLMILRTNCKRESVSASTLYCG